VRLVPEEEEAAATSDEQTAAEADRGDQPGDDETMRNWPPNWSSSGESNQQSSSTEDQR
jgi:hypothetical protein